MEHNQKGYKMKTDFSQAIVVLQTRKKIIEKVIHGAEGLGIPAVEELQSEKKSIVAALNHLEKLNKKSAKVK